VGKASGLAEDCEENKKLLGVLRGQLGEFEDLKPTVPLLKVKKDRGGVSLATLNSKTG